MLAVDMEDEEIGGGKEEKGEGEKGRSKEMREMLDIAGCLKVDRLRIKPLGSYTNKTPRRSMKAKKTGFR